MSENFPPNRASPRYSWEIRQDSRGARTEAPRGIQVSLIKRNDRGVRTAFPPRGPVYLSRVRLFIKNTRVIRGSSGAWQGGSDGDRNRRNVRSILWRSRLDNGGATCVCAPFCHRVFARGEMERSPPSNRQRERVPSTVQDSGWKREKGASVGAGRGWQWGASAGDRWRERGAAEHERKLLRRAAVRGGELRAGSSHSEKPAEEDAIRHQPVTARYRVWSSQMLLAFRHFHWPKSSCIDIRGLCHHELSITSCVVSVQGQLTFRGSR